MAGVVLHVAIDKHDEIACGPLAFAGAIMEDATAVAIVGQDDVTLSQRPFAVAQTHGAYRAACSPDRAGQPLMPERGTALRRRSHTAADKWRAED